MTGPRDRISLATATSVTVANMVGTGVFASLGFQLLGVKTGFGLLTLWAVGGVLALCGALTYGELAAALPRSGGEYNFLSRTFHPSLGFLAGWLSLTAGFAPPIALVAMAFGSYFSQALPGTTPLVLSCAVVAVVTFFHLRDLKLASSFQNAFTVFKVALLLVFIALPFFAAEGSGMSFAPTREALGEIVGPSFGLSLLFVLFAYAGWNAGSYIVGEVREPQKNVPRALFAGTLLVTVLYVAVHWAFLATTPADMFLTETPDGGLTGRVEIGHVVATHVLGETGGRWMSTLLSLALVSSISAMTWAGPRVTQVMGEDYAFFRALAHTNPAGVPVRAILLQTAIVYLMLLTSTFDSVLVYVQMLLTASSALTVAAVFELRRKKVEAVYRTWGYPVTPVLFLLISVAAMGYTAWQRPLETLLGFATLALGIPVYLYSPRLSART